MRWLAVGLALGHVSSASPALAQWWKEPAPPSRLDQRAVAPSGESATRLKWDDGYVEVKAGATADTAIALNCAHEKNLALDAARQLAYMKLAEIVHGVRVDGTTVVKDAMVADQVVRTTVQGRIRGARVLGEQVVDPTCGSVWAEVRMGLLLRGPGSLSEAIAPWAAAKSADAYAPDSRARVADRYTGLIVDGSDTGFSPALAPRVFEEGSCDKVVFGPQTVQVAALSQQGPVGYASTMTDARDTGRAGANPLVVRAIPPEPPDRPGLKCGRIGKGDLVLSRKDADRVLAADRDGGFLARGAVVIVLGKDLRQLASERGRRHAVVVGINDYPQGVDGAFARLDFAARDARELASALVGRGGFARDEVTLLVDGDATRARIIERLGALRARLREEDVVVIYFAGHGSVGLGADGRPHYYLVPRDGQMTKLAGTALVDDLLEELIGQLPSRQVVVMLDACYSGGGTGAIRARGQRSPSLTALPPPRPIVEAAAGRILMAASKPEQEAWEHPEKGGGLFTSYLVEGLAGAADRDGDGAVTALELFQFVSRHVPEYARRQIQVEQTPILEVRGLSGEIVLARRP